MSKFAMVKEGLLVPEVILGPKFPLLSPINPIQRSCIICLNLLKAGNQADGLATASHVTIFSLSGCFNSSKEEIDG